MTLFERVAIKMVLFRLTCLILVLARAGEALGQEPAKKKDPEWLAELKADPRLQALVKYNHKVRPTAEEWFGILNKATGVKFTIAPQEQEGKVTFAVGTGGMPAWWVMRMLGERQVLEGKWEKVGDGYRLHGKPKSKTTGMWILTPEEEAAEIARKEEIEKARAIAAANKYKLPKDHPLAKDPINTPPKVKIIPPPDPPGPEPHHADPRLRKKVTFHLAGPPVDAVLRKLAEETQVAFIRAEGVPNKYPATASISVTGVPAWQVMDHLAGLKRVEGRWEKSGDGYRIVPNGTAPVIEEEQAELAQTQRTRQRVIIAGVLGLTLAAVVGLAALRRRGNRSKS